MVTYNPCKEPSFTVGLYTTLLVGGWLITFFLLTKAKPKVPRTTKEQGIVIPIIPPVDKPDFFFYYIVL